LAIERPVEEAALNCVRVGLSKTVNFPHNGTCSFTKMSLVHAFP